MDKSEEIEETELPVQVEGDTTQNDNLEDQEHPIQQDRNQLHPD